MDNITKKEVQLQTLINVVLRDLGLRHKEVEYSYIPKLDTVTAITCDKYLYIRFNDNLDSIEHIELKSHTGIVLYENDHVPFSEVLANKLMSNAIFLYDYDRDEL